MGPHPPRNLHPATLRAPRQHTRTSTGQSLDLWSEYVGPSLYDAFPALPIAEVDEIMYAPAAESWSKLGMGQRIGDVGAIALSMFKGLRRMASLVRGRGAPWLRCAACARM